LSSFSPVRNYWANYRVFRRNNQPEGLAMDKDRVAGGVKKATGKVKEQAGKVLGDASTEAEGKADQAEGRAQGAVGHAKDAIREIAGKK
jgi:uncharacterized protein YjbJ (UPF0337 family)